MKYSYRKDCKMLHKEGYTNREIAEYLQIHLRTVQRHIKNLNLKPNLENTNKLLKLERYKKYGNEQKWKVKQQHAHNVREAPIYYDSVESFLRTNKIWSDEAEIIRECNRYATENLVFGELYLTFSYTTEELRRTNDRLKTEKHHLNTEVKKLKQKVEYYEAVLKKIQQDMEDNNE